MGRVGIAKWLSALGALGFAVLPQIASACPGCSKVSEDISRVEPETVMAGIAFSWSVLFLLGVVFAAVGLLTGYIVRTVRRLDDEKQK